MLHWRAVMDEMNIDGHMLSQVRDVFDSNAYSSDGDDGYTMSESATESMRVSLLPKCHSAIFVPIAAKLPFHQVFTDYALL